MTEKQIIDRLDSINLSLRQKKDLLSVIKDIADNSSGGGDGTSTDKDFLTMLVDYDTKTVTVNDKQFLISTINEGIIEINNKELYNSLVNTDIHVFIKTIGADFNIDGYATRMFDEIAIQLLLYVVDGMFAIVIYNK